MRKKTLGLLALLCYGLLCRIAPVAADEAVQHRVKKGDTLWGISGAYLKDSHAWPKVWKQNPAIKNPNRIAPGQVVKLPGKAKTKANVRPAAAAAPTLSRAMTANERSGPPLALTVVQDAPVKAKAVEGTLVIQHTRGVGQVTSDLPDDGMVLVTQGGWRGDAMGGTIFVQAADAKVGAIYGVYRDLGKVKPVSFFKGSPGRLLAEIGTVEVVALQGDRQVAKITKSYDVVQQGDLLGPLPAPIPPLTVKDQTAAVSATVVAVEFNRLVAAAKDVVYLDAGADQGLAPGDRLQISGSRESNERRQSAAVAVLRVTPTTAAVLVLPESDHQVQIGDTVRPAQ